MTSHAAVVARGMGKCCVTGCSDLEINTVAKTDVSGRIKITFLPASACALASSAENTICPVAAPGLAGKPIFEISVACFSAFSSKLGCNNWSVQQLR
jgi:hypothetical protein